MMSYILKDDDDDDYDNDILNKQLWTADKRWSFSLVVGRGANNFSPHEILHMDIFFGTT
jgi:hypothetical protein